MELLRYYCQVSHVDAADADRVIELFCGLDDWLTKGGALPQDWRR